VYYRPSGLSEGLRVPSRRAHPYRATLGWMRLDDFERKQLLELGKLEEPDGECRRSDHGTYESTRALGASGS
jgi:hypothetical protein